MQAADQPKLPNQTPPRLDVADLSTGTDFALRSNQKVLKGRETMLSTEVRKIVGLDWKGRDCADAGVRTTTKVLGR